MVEHHDNAHHLTAKEVRQHAGPWLIALGVALKSLLALATATGLEVWGAAHMHDWMGVQIERYNLNPDHGLFASLMQHTTQDTVHVVAGVLLAYSCVHGAEAWGLWRDKPWASWLGCIGAAIYLPIEIIAMFRSPGWLAFCAVIVNLLVVLVLGWNIRRLKTLAIGTSN